MVSLLSPRARSAPGFARTLGTASFPPRPLSLLSTGGGRHLIAVIVAEVYPWTTSERVRLVKSGLKRATSLPRARIRSTELTTASLEIAYLSRERSRYARIVLTSGISSFLRGYQAKCHQNGSVLLERIHYRVYRAMFYGGSIKLGCNAFWLKGISGWGNREAWLQQDTII